MFEYVENLISSVDVKNISMRSRVESNEGDPVRRLVTGGSTRRKQVFARPDFKQLIIEINKGDRTWDLVVSVYRKDATVSGALFVEEKVAGCNSFTGFGGYYKKLQSDPVLDPSKWEIDSYFQNHITEDFLRDHLMNVVSIIQDGRDPSEER